MSGCLLVIPKTKKLHSIDQATYLKESMNERIWKYLIFIDHGFALLAKRSS